MYMITGNRISLNDFREGLFEKMRTGDYRPIILDGVKYPENIRCKFEINFHTLNGKKVIKLHTIGSDGNIINSLIINIDWGNETEMFSFVDNEWNLVNTDGEIDRPQRSARFNIIRLFNGDFIIDIKE